MVVLDRSLHIRIYTTAGPFIPSQDDLAVLRRALLHRRQAYTADHEELLLKTTNEDVLRQLQERLSPVERLMKSDWFLAGKPCGIPRITDFVSIQEVYSLMRDTLLPPQIEYDEKFGILLSPSQFLRRLALARREGDLRGTPVSIAFIDIDDFKSFNSKYGEFIVDKSVLPVLMRRMEAHVHAQGFAFRFGGDEYMMLLPNLNREQAISSCIAFQRSLASLKFVGADKPLSVSIGLCTSEADSPLTNRELQQRATDAKQIAKRNEKNCVAWVNGDVLIESTPVISRP